MEEEDDSFQALALYKFVMSCYFTLFRECSLQLVVFQAYYAVHFFNLFCCLCLLPSLIDSRVASYFVSALKKLIDDSSDLPVIVIATTSAAAQISSDINQCFLHCLSVEVSSLWPLPPHAFACCCLGYSGLRKRELFCFGQRFVPLTRIKDSLGYCYVLGQKDYYCFG